jgi:hypothetical protein
MITSTLYREILRDIDELSSDWQQNFSMLTEQEFKKLGRNYRIVSKHITDRCCSKNFQEIDYEWAIRRTL